MKELVMKRIIMSALAVAAFGATSLGPQTAEAVGWEGSGWQPVGSWLNFRTSGGNYAADYAISTPIAPSGVTLSANTTGTVGATPTCHAAWTLCNNGDYIVAPYKCAWTVGGTANETFTSNTGGTYEQWNSFTNSYQQVADTGHCPSGQPIVKGGVSVYQY
jgi:hypothetical protein